MNKQQREEILRNDLSGLKAGDTVLNLREASDSKSTIVKSVGIALYLLSGEMYDIHGREISRDRYPVIFKSLDNCIAYFQALKEQEEEASVWTPQKVFKATEFGVGSYFSDGFCDSSTKLVVNKDSQLIYYIELGELEVRRFNYGLCKNLKNYELYDRAGNLIDPREY